MELTELALDRGWDGLFEQCLRGSVGRWGERGLGGCGLSAWSETRLGDDCMEPHRLSWHANSCGRPGDNSCDSMERSACLLLQAGVDCSWRKSQCDGLVEA